MDAAADTVSALFLRATDQFSDRLAWCSGETSATYADLLHAAATISDAIGATDKGASRVVAINVCGSWGRLASVFGTLLGGRAFTSIDAESSQSLRDAQLDSSQLVIHCRHRASQVPRDRLSISVRCEFSRGNLTPGAQREWSRTSADSPAAIFFTSGTTGRPRGAVLPHRAITRLIRHPEGLPYDSQTGVILHSPTSWDATCLEMLLPLMTGGQVFAHEQAILDPAGIEQCRVRGANTVWLTASLFHTLAERSLQSFEGMRLVMTGGERVSARAAVRVKKAYPGLTLINGYGPVESCTFATTYSVKGDEAEPLPVGTPVPGTVIELRKPSGAMSAACSEGQIIILGEGLLLGYVQRGEQVGYANELHSPQSSEYATGDLGYVGAGGLLYVTGRMDRQVKLHGIRLELSAFETRALEYPGVTQAYASLVRTSDFHAGVLVVLCVADRDVETPALTRHIATVFPRPGLNLQCSVLSSLPRTKRDKLDLATLDRLAVMTATESYGEVPQADLLQFPHFQAIALETLGHHLAMGVSLRDQGVGSLQTLVLVTEVGARYALEVGVQEMLGDVPLMALAERVEEAAGSVVERPGGSAATDIRPPRSAIREESYFGFRELWRPGDPAIRVLLEYELHGVLNVQALIGAWSDLVEMHAGLRSILKSTRRGFWLEREAYRPSLEVGELGTRNQVVNFLLRRVDLWREPCVALLHVHGPASATVLVCIHHALFDGWSERILCRDLAERYRIRDSMETSNILPEGPPKAHHDYLAAPHGHDVPHVLRHPQHEVHMSLPRNRLRDISTILNVSEAAIALAMHAWALQRARGVQEIRIAMPVNARSDLDDLRQIRCLVLTQVLVVPTTRNASELTSVCDKLCTDSASLGRTEVVAKLAVQAPSTQELLSCNNLFVYQDVAPTLQLGTDLKCQRTAPPTLGLQFPMEVQVFADDLLTTLRISTSPATDLTEVQAYSQLCHEFIRRLG